MLSQDYDKKAEIARILTEELSRINGIPKEPIVVLFHNLSTEDVANSGLALKEQFKPRNEYAQDNLAKKIV